MIPTLETEPSCSDRSACVCVCLWVCVDAMSLLDLLTLFGAFLYFFECAYAYLPMAYWRHSKGPRQPETEQKSLTFLPWLIHFLCSTQSIRSIVLWKEECYRCLAVDCTENLPPVSSFLCLFQTSNFNIVVEMVLAKEKEKVISIKMWFVKSVITWLQRTKLKIFCVFISFSGLLHNGRECLHIWP